MNMNEQGSIGAKTGVFSNRGIWRREVDEMKTDMGLMTRRQKSFQPLRDFGTRLALLLTGRASPRNATEEAAKVVAFDKSSRSTG